MNYSLVIRHIKYFVSKLLFVVPDSLMLQILFAVKLKKQLNLDAPKTYNEKLQWLKLYDRKKIYTVMVDKFAVKEYVNKIIGSKYIIPTLGVWDTPEDIDFSRLPNQFVLKTTHGGGGKSVVVCKNKANFDIPAAIRILKMSLKEDIYISHREWPYKNVPKRILAEKYINSGDGDLSDYKFYCFNGEAKIMLVSNNRFHGKTEFDYFDMNFKHLPFTQGGSNSRKTITKPKHFEEMRLIAEKLSFGIPHVRVDLYDVNNQVYFGELTFFDSSGFSSFTPEIWDYKLGQMIVLPQKS